MGEDTLILELRGLARVLDTDSSPSGAEAVRRAITEISGIMQQPHPKALR